MSKMAKDARKAMRTKAERLVRADPKGVVDASGYTPPDALNADIKTGLRPLSRKNFRKGGKVVAADNSPKAKMHAGRKPRKTGGAALTADSLINRDVREANEKRDGIKHVGGFKKGGKVHRKHRADGGSDTIDNSPAMQKLRNIARDTDPRDLGYPLPSDTNANIYSLGSDSTDWGEKPGAWVPNKLPIKRLFKKGGKIKKAKGGVSGITQWLKDHESDYDDRTGAGAITDDQGNDYDPNQDGDGKKRGGRAKKLVGGPAMGDMQDPRVMAQAALAQSNRGQVPVGLLNSVPTTSRMSRSAGLKTGGKAEHPDEAQDKKLVRQMVKMSALTGKKHGGHLSVSDGEMEGTRPTGGRLARATGGKTGKGKTNINIVISPHGAGQQMPPQGGMPPMPPRPAGVPMPMTGAAPAPQPPMPMPVPMPMQAPQQPPMGRKHGGRTYRSYKDMDAGAGSGEGRLEKSEIQKRK